MKDEQEDRRTRGELASCWFCNGVVTQGEERTDRMNKGTDTQVGQGQRT